MRDLAAETAVLSCLYNYGNKYYFEISQLIKPKTFTLMENEVLFLCLQHSFEKLGVKKPDIGSIYSSAQDLGFESKINSSKYENHINQVINFYADPDNFQECAKRIKRLEITREIIQSIDQAHENLEGITGNEDLSHILSLAEEPIFNISKSIGETDSEPKRLVDEIEGYIEDKVNNPIDQIGVSTGFPLFDEAIGGGLRDGTTTVFGARAKNFKSGVAKTIGDHVSSMGIPVLYLDTELQASEQIPRLLAKHSNIDIQKIERGDFNEGIVKTSAKNISEEFYHKNIAGTGIQEQVSIMRRWIHKDVGVQLDGTAKKCVIIYDYLKLMESSGLKDMKEYQAIGFILNELNVFAIKYNIPIVSFVQLNRDGISREDSAAIAQSDRILWFCSSFSIIKRKSKEEIEMERESNIPEEFIGNYKLIPTDCRHGPGLQNEGDYISLGITGSRFQIKELGLYSDLQDKKPKKLEMEIDSPDDIQPVDF